MALRHIAIAFFTLAAAVTSLSVASIAQTQEGFPPPPAPTSILVEQPGEGSPMDVVSAPSQILEPEGSTHPLVRLTPDKSEIIRVDTPIRSLIIGNPAHLNILMDSAKTLVLVPRTPGATHFTALDEAGRVIMQRHVIVASPQEQYVRIRRSCVNAGGGDCQETSVYYCPDMCHPVSIMRADQGQPTTSAAGSSGDFTIQMSAPASALQEGNVQ